MKGLISKKKWEANIDSLRAQTISSSKEELKSKIVEAIVKSIPSKKFGLFLSGGVDSSLIALILKKQKANFICYSVGMEGADDLIWAKKLAKILKFKLKTKEYSLNEAETLFKKTASLFKKPEVLNVGVGAVEIASAQLAKKDKINIFYGGLGSEEIFAGYERHLRAKNVHEECWHGLRNVLWQRDLVRDATIANAMKIKFITPFLDDEVIKCAMGIDVSRKISEQHKKIILREIAEELGLPNEFAWRKKKAAQYGSRFDWAIEKLARKYGFRTKQEWVKSLR